MTMLADSIEKPKLGEHGLIFWATAVLILKDATDAKFSDTTILYAKDILRKSLTTHDSNKIVTSLSSNLSIKLNNIRLHLPTSTFYRLTAERRAPQKKEHAKRMKKALKMVDQGHSCAKASSKTGIPAATLRSHRWRSK